jgi:16S rRNA (guanine527-N7)-methyltransferase
VTTGDALDRDALRAALGRLDLPVAAGLEDRLERHAALLRAWNARVNLTRITSPDGVAVEHMADSLACLLALPADANTLIDVGSGAGFPGLPLALARLDCAVTLLEAAGKKCQFLEAAVAVTDSSATVLHGRAEDLGHDPAHRAAYDVAVARAVAPMATLVELLLPFLRVGGTAVAMKGGGAADEVAQARAALDVLCGRHARTVTYELPGLAPRHLVVIEKTAPTPARFPRRPGVPARRPL